ncbi:leucine zipper putative tumor suppressor 2-like [Daphnia carinata]|uniref:leucine zipper putative tumor suppressor 2-like n=1 Tax=Daphnia carinata TaxID=120202 RepID=UPI0028683F0E|nr:leucine zipper putative tumor suppressor 2-like [Daphnia carinata]
MLTLSEDSMMDDVSDYMTPIPIFIPELLNPSDNQAQFQSQQEFSSDSNENTNRNQLGISSFSLQLTFNGIRGANWPSSIQLSSQSLEDEARQSEEQLDASRQTLSRLEDEVLQLERANKELSSESEVTELMVLEQFISRLEEELAQCRTSAINSSEESVLKAATAKATRTKRFETECALRELQLSICRRKLEYATAKALNEEDDGSCSSDDEASISVSNLPEEEERINILQHELEELNQVNNRALSEAKDAELLNAKRQRAQLEVEQKISMGRGRYEERRQHLEEKRRQLEINHSYLVKMKNAEELQQKLYFLLEQLQEMARQLPLQYQQRMPYELLSGLANCLLNETIFKIVEGLTEIQQVTEKQLLQQRLKLLHRHRAEKEALAKKTPDSVTEAEKMEVANHPVELKQADMNLILQLDQVVADQQSTLEKAGVPGFYLTSNPQEIQVQMYLLEFILKLGKESENNTT